MVLVQAEAGKPKAISSRGRWRQVIEIDEIWRVEEGWWRRLPIRRTYFRVHLEADVDVTVFQDLVEATWWIQKY
jgi:hypothetical protein